MITRSEVVNRAYTGWGGLEKVPYSQSALWSDGYRQDCSGFVSMAAGLPKSGDGTWGGYNTVTLVTKGKVRLIDPDDLQPGDLIGRLGEGTAGDAGHVQVFVAWLNNDPDDNGHYVLEQTGPTGSPGPHKRLYSDWHDGYQAWRLVGNAADAPEPPPPPAPQQTGLVTDGVLGTLTITRWQQIMGTPVDGFVTQPPGRSDLVTAVQRRLNAAFAAGLREDGQGICQDGRSVYKTTRALQRYLGTYQDGVLSVPTSQCVRALQQRLNAGWF